MSFPLRQLRLIKGSRVLRTGPAWLQYRQYASQYVHPTWAGRELPSKHDKPGWTGPKLKPDPEDGEQKATETSSQVPGEEESTAERLPDGTFSPIEEPRLVPHFVMGTPGVTAILGSPRNKAIRARFAPSPTGDLHLGSLRTALFNKLAANGTKGGKFVVRIEDTDQSRLVPGAEERLLKDLEWAGIEWDEGPDRGGPYGPYRQSERLDIYKKHIQQLIDSGHAYRCFCSPEHLEAQKERLAAEGQPTAYPKTCRHIGSEESAARAAEGERHTVRFKSADQASSFRDAVYGLFKKRDPDEDFVLMKSDGYPTYHFANVVDDHLMEITHVIRGDEWLISTPKHIALYEAFGWKPPTFAHLGLLVNKDGSKLSKRDNNVSLEKYKAENPLPLAFLRWLGTMGSSFHSKIIPRTFDELTHDFTFKFTKGGIQLNFEKKQNFDGRYAGALVANPRLDLQDEEEALIEKHMIQPMLKEVAHLTHNNDATVHPSSPLSDPHYHYRPLELVPTLAPGSDPKAQSRYMRIILDGGTRIGVERAGSLVQTHPYYFWRPPISLYRESLAVATPPDLILDALEELIAEKHRWNRDAPPLPKLVVPHQPMVAKGPHDRRWGVKDYHTDEHIGNKLFEELGHLISPQYYRKGLYHGSIRVVAVGSFAHHSQSSPRMFNVLSREEWRARLKIVRDIIREQEEAGTRPPIFSIKEAAPKLGHRKPKQNAESSAQGQAEGQPTEQAEAQSNGQADAAGRT